MYRELLNKIKVFSTEEFKKATEETRDYIDRMTDEDFKSVVREIGTIPENIEHDSTEEKLYSKASDIVLARCFRMLGLAARNQKDFKVSNLSDWRGSENEYAVLVAPYFQYSQETSQIYSKALENNVCLLSWEHMSALLDRGIKETETLSLESLWNASQMIARDKTLSFANAKCCFYLKWMCILRRRWEFQMQNTKIF